MPQNNGRNEQEGNALKGQKDAILPPWNYGTLNPKSLGPSIKALVIGTNRTKSRANRESKRETHNIYQEGMEKKTATMGYPKT